MAEAQTVATASAPQPAAKSASGDVAHIQSFEVLWKVAAGFARRG